MPKKEECIKQYIISACAKQLVMLSLMAGDEDLIQAYSYLESAKEKVCTNTK